MILQSKQFNDKLYVQYRPKDGLNLTHMIFGNAPLTKKRNWNIEKRVPYVHVYKPEWFTKDSFLIPYGTITVCDKFGPYSATDFNARDFFKEKNMYLFWEQHRKDSETSTATEVAYYMRLTWINRKGFGNRIHTTKEVKNDEQANGADHQV